MLPGCGGSTSCPLLRGSRGARPLPRAATLARRRRAAGIVDILRCAGAVGPRRARQQRSTASDSPVGGNGGRTPPVRGTEHGDRRGRDSAATSARFLIRRPESGESSGRSDPRARKKTKCRGPSVHGPASESARLRAFELHPPAVSVLIASAAAEGSTLVPWTRRRSAGRRQDDCDRALGDRRKRACTS